MLAVLWFVVLRLAALLVALAVLSLSGCALIVHADGPAVHEMLKGIGWGCLLLTLLCVIGLLIREGGPRK